MGRIAALAALAFWLAAPAAAQVESRCYASQMKASGAQAAAEAKCESKAAAKGEPVDPECLAKAAAKAAKALAKAEQKEDCIVTAPDAAVDAAVESFVLQLRDVLNPPPVSCCEIIGSCFYAADPATCTGAPVSGTLGAEGSVCDGSTGDCLPPPATAGGCCDDVSAAGVSFDCVGGVFMAADCTGAGGTFSTGVCSPSGDCI
jgi:hypothetical protein